MKGKRAPIGLLGFLVLALSACAIPFTRELGLSDLPIPLEFLRGSFTISSTSSPTDVSTLSEREFRRIGPYRIAYTPLDQRVRIGNAELRYRICFQRGQVATFSGTIRYRAYMGPSERELYGSEWLLAEGILDASQLNDGKSHCIQGNRPLTRGQVDLLPGGQFYLGATWSGEASSQPQGARVNYEVEELRFVLSGSLSPF